MRKITYNGETHTIAEWARLTGMNRHTIDSRLHDGWTPEEIFGGRKTTDRRKKGDWSKVRKEKLTSDMITDDAAMKMCAALMQQTRKDLKACIKRKGNILEYRRFFDTTLCNLILDCMGIKLEGKEVYRKVEREIKKELKNNDKRRYYRER